MHFPGLPSHCWEIKEGPGKHNQLLFDRIRGGKEEGGRQKRADPFSK